MARQDVILRAIVTKNKPEEMLKISPKGTVPILILEDGGLIDESLNIMLWALKRNDPEDLLYANDSKKLDKMLKLIDRYDHEYRPILSAYKHAYRFHLETKEELLSKCEIYMREIEELLKKNNFIMGNKLSLVDISVLPFVRQFVNVNKRWFREAGYPKLGRWLTDLMQSMLFNRAMRKYPLWLESHQEFLLSWDS